MKPSNFGQRVTVWNSVYGSTDIVDDFNVKFEVYGEPLDTGKYLDPSLTQAFADLFK